MSMDAETAQARNRELAGLLCQTARGSRAAFQRLYEATAPQLYGILLRMLKRRDLAEEALQEAFVNVWQNAAGYDAGKGAVGTWLASIVRYRALDLLRRERRLVPVEDAPALADARLEPAHPLEPMSEAEQRNLEICLQRLSERQHRSLELAYFGGRTHEEIARQLRSPLGTVKSWVRRGLQRLRDCLEGL